MNPSNRRKHARIPVGVSGLVYVSQNREDAVPCEILDISVGGAFIHATAPVRINQEVTIEIHFETNTLLAAKVIHPDDTQRLATPEKTVVRWVRGSSKTGFGVEFIALSQEKRTYLDKLVVHFEKMRSENKKQRA